MNFWRSEGSFYRWCRRTETRPSLKNAEDMVMIISAFTCIRKMRFGPALRSLARIWKPRAYAMAIGWLLRRRYPRRFSSIVRTVIWRNETEVVGGSDSLAGVVTSSPLIRCL